MSTATMFYPNEDIVEASVTKSRPGQSLGLALKEQNNEERRIYVEDIVDGLFRSSEHGVQSGDELLEVNGIPVSNFENGLRDLRKFMQGEWSINIRVGRNSSNQSCSMDSTDTIATSASSLLDNLSAHEALLSDGDQPLVDHSSHEKDAPVVPKRRGRRKSRESLGSLIRDVRSRTPSDRGSSSGPRRGKRPDSTHSRSNSNHSRSKSNRSRSRSKKTHEEEKPSSSSHSRSSSRKSKKTKRDRKKSKDSSSHKKKKEKKTNESNSSMSNHINESTHSRQSDVAATSSASTSTTTTNTNQQIRGVQCSSSCVTLEMKDGKRVSVNPMDLMALMTEEDGKLVPISNRKLDITDDRPVLEKTKATKTLAVVSDNDESDNDEDEQYDTVATHLTDLKTLLQNRNKPTQNDCSSLENPWARRSMSTLDEFQSTSAPTSLRKLLGERLRTTNPKKWEESSMVSSTLACMTNLIDPGDLMKIRNFDARPGLNGATVEIVCKSSIGSKWNDRWDVRVIQRKNQRASDSNLGNKLISVAAENLRHFV